MASSRLLSMDPMSYTVADVTEWLNLVGFGNVAENFQKNSVEGLTLLELEDSDLVDLGLKRLGPRKQLLRKIENLRKQKASAWTDAADGGEKDSLSSSESTGSSRIEKSLSEYVSIKLNYEGEVSVIKVKRTEKFKSAVKKASKSLGFDVALSYKDDGDEIALKSRSDWKAFFPDAVKSANSIKLIAKLANGGPEGGNGIVVPDAVKSVYAAMGDMAILIDTDGVILFINAAATKRFQWTEREAVGQNIKILMSSLDASSHDFYLHRFTRNPNQPRIVGKGSRLVIAMAKDRSDVPVNLSVSMLKTPEGKMYFAGVMTPATKTVDDDEDPSAKYNVLNALMSPALVIDTDGDVLFVNQAVTQQLGYLSVDLMGENISMIMPEPHRSQHDQYLANYLRTGQAKVIGTKRKLEVLHADGHKLPIMLTVSQLGRGDDRTFTGIIDVQEVEELNGAAFVEKTSKKVHKMMIPSALMDGNGILRCVNKAFTRSFGYEPDEVVGKNVKMLMPENIAVKHDAFLRNFAKNPDKESTVVGKGRQVTVLLKDKSMVVMHLAVKRYADSDNLAFFLGTFQQQ